MTPQVLSTTAAVMLSLLFSYVPGISNWYEALEATRKRLLMLALLLVVTAGSFAIACLGWGELLNVPVTCDKPGAAELLGALVLALTANQSTYMISPKPERRGEKYA